MREIAFVLLVALLPMLFAACGASDEVGSETSSNNGEITATDLTQTVLDKDVTYRFLFIGNSYTYYNELWTMFRSVAQSAGYRVRVDSVTKGAYYLDQFADANDTYGAQVKEKLEKNTYDYVFLQEQSTAPILHYDRFSAGAQTLFGMISDNGAECLLYQTWGRKAGHSTLEKNNWTNESMTRDLEAAYGRLADALQVRVSPVGTAFYKAYTEHPEIDLYDEDLTHPSRAGTYLAALCHFATVMGEDPVTVTFNGGLSAAEATVLKQVASDVIFGK